MQPIRALVDVGGKPAHKSRTVLGLTLLGAIIAIEAEAPSLVELLPPTVRPWFLLGIKLVGVWLTATGLRGALAAKP